MLRSNEKNRAISVLSSVFSQNQKVATIRLAILRFVNNSTNGRMRFTEILRSVQSTTDEFYNSQRLAFDLRVLRTNSLVDQTATGDYTITTYGYYVLDVYRRISGGLESKLEERPGFVGGASGFISVDGFNFDRIGEELERFGFFKKTPSDDQDRLYLVWKDEEDFSSEIEISRDGRFTVQIVLFIDLPVTKGAFKEDLEDTAKWHDYARSFAQTIVYYLQKAVLKLWKDADIIVSLGPDSYPINLYAGGHDVGKHTDEPT